MLSDGYIRVPYPSLCSFVYFEVSCNWGLIEPEPWEYHGLERPIRTTTVTCSSDCARRAEERALCLEENRKKGSVFRGREVSGFMPCGIKVWIFNHF